MQTIYTNAMLIVISGMPGTGKSTLAEQLDAPVFSVDPIESAILAAGLPRTFETGLAAYLVAAALAGGELARGRDAVADAVSSIPEAHAMWLELAATHATAIAVIECVCSDEVEHRRRLAVRRRPYGFEPTWESVVERRAAATAWPVETLVVDAMQQLASNVAAVRAWIGSRAPAVR